MTYVPPRIRGLHAGGSQIAEVRRFLLIRDGRGCRRCGVPIDMTLPGTDPNGPTIGHVIPVASGGTDARSNLCLEHRRCNLAAGDRADPPRASLAIPIRESR